MGYYLTRKRDDILTHATMWIRLENVMKKSFTEDHIWYDSTHNKCLE